MIAKPEWFRKKRIGWGVTPKTQEGWFYTLGFVAVLLYISFFVKNETVVLILTLGVVTLFLIDLIPCVIKVNKEK